MKRYIVTDDEIQKFLDVCSYNDFKKTKKELKEELKEAIFDDASIGMTITAYEVIFKPLYKGKVAKSVKTRFFIEKQTNKGK